MAGRYRKMSVQDARVELSRGFGLSDQVSLTELRGSGWRRRLAERHKLRLVDRHEPIGVLVSADLWEAMESLVAYLERLEEEFEEREIDRLWGHRLNHERGPAREEAQRLRELMQGE